MLSPIARVDSVEMIRDGGSLAATFMGIDGSKYWLFFPVLVDHSVPGYVTTLGYGDPQVVDCLVGTAVTVSWQHATVLLNQIRPWLKDEEHLSTLEVLADIAAHEGAVTAAAIERFPSLRGPSPVVRLGAWDT
jgi:hypothetical protein